MKDPPPWFRKPIDREEEIAHAIDGWHFIDRDPFLVAEQMNGSGFCWL